MGLGVWVLAFRVESLGPRRAFVVEKYNEDDEQDQLFCRHNHVADTQLHQRLQSLGTFLSLFTSFNCVISLVRSFLFLEVGDG